MEAVVLAAPTLLIAGGADFRGEHAAEVLVGDEVELGAETLVDVEVALAVASTAVLIHVEVLREQELHGPSAGSLHLDGVGRSGHAEDEGQKRGQKNQTFHVILPFFCGCVMRLPFQRHALSRLLARFKNFYKPSRGKKYQNFYNETGRPLAAGNPRLGTNVVMIPGGA